MVFIKQSIFFIVTYALFCYNIDCVHTNVPSNAFKNVSYIFILNNFPSSAQLYHN